MNYTNVIFRANLHRIGAWHSRKSLREGGPASIFIKQWCAPKALYGLSSKMSYSVCRSLYISQRYLHQSDSISLSTAKAGINKSNNDLFHRRTNNFICACHKINCVENIKRNYSDLKDDPDLKGLISEIREDFNVKTSTESDKEEIGTSKKTDEPDDFDEIENDFGYEDSGKTDAKNVSQHKENLAASEDSQLFETVTSFEEIEDFPDYFDRELEEPDLEPEIPLTRGVTGVFDLEELVQLLKEDRAQDLVAIRMPAEVHFGDYMVIASAFSLRHINAMKINVNRTYKKKKNKKDRFVKVSGDKTSTWIAMDLGNIILHLFMPHVREQYDLETLWTIGEQFDENFQDPFEEYTKQLTDLEWLEELATKESTT